MKPYNDQRFRDANNKARASNSQPLRLNKAEVVRDAVASVIDDLDERPDDRTIMLMRHAAQRVAQAYEHQTMALAS